MATFILVPGMWLGAWAWRPVARLLHEAGHETYPLTLTGLADRAHLTGPGIDLDTHVADVVTLVEAEDLRDVVLVAHSYAGLPVSMAAARLQGRIREVVYVDSGPLPEGTTQLSLLESDEATGDAVPPPAWDPTADPALLAGLDGDALALMRARATAHPAGCVRQPLGRRATAADLPTTLVTCIVTAEQAHGLIAQEHPFFAGLTGARIIGLPTGHWPMLSEPKALAAALDGLTR